MPLIETKGAASAQGFGEFAASSAGAVTYIEDVFSTYLYTGNGSTQTITNGIDLSTNGGLVWIKDRSQGTGYHHILQDTARGASWCLFSNLTSAQTQDSAGTNFAFNNNGFFIGSSNVKINGSDNYASWTFRKQPKFFDVVTYTGNGTAGRTVSHNLGATPGVIIVKRTDGATNWRVYHRSLGATQYLDLDETNAAASATTIWNDTAPTSTVFSVGTNSGVNASGGTYVAYLFAHDAGGFGLTGTDNVISCGSYTTNASGNATITLGYEPQWILMKNINTVSDWVLYDNMRGLTAPAGTSNRLFPNLSSAAADTTSGLSATSTGFFVNAGGASGYSETSIYIAIRRGPMKVPTDATKIFTPIAATPSSGASTSIAVTPDMFLFKGRNINDPFWTEDRLRFFDLVNTSSAKQLQVNSVNAEQTQLPLAYYIQNANMLWGGYLDTNSSIIYNFKRAPSVFDEVCYTGTGVARTVTHNLGVAPELLIVKMRSSAGNWRTYAASQGNTKQAVVNATDQFDAAGVMWNSTTPTASVFSLGNDSEVNGSGQTYVAYLFATCAGVSKVGSYTGTGSTQTISCGFTGGARFVLIKRANSAGSWWVWDTARGMVSGNDKRLALNSQASEVNADWVYTTTGGFQVVTNDAEVNASGGTYIFLAIA